MDSDYKKYSLEKLETWVEDALNSAEASPQEIYDCIRKVVEDNYYCYKNQTSRCYELLALLNGNGKGHIQAYDEYVEKKENLVSDKEDPSPERKKSWNDFWEEYYYPEEVKDDGMHIWGHSDLEYGIANQKKDKVKKWVLPVEETKIAETDETEYFVSFPDDLLEAADLKEGDQIEWIDQADGSYMLKKVNKYPSWVTGNELSKTKTYDEMIAEGYTMTGDGFWIKE
jgi:bifunctional DNA-binding transcriptional regulator/antitoxin component of YhaV-PrlF toxin-antitoxin module